MGLDRSVNRTVDTQYITSLANAIRKKTSTTDALIFPDGFVNAINSLNTLEGLHTQISSLSGSRSAIAITYTLLENNQFIKDHYSDQGFFAMLVPVALNQPTTYKQTYYLQMAYGSNYPMTHNVDNTTAVYGTALFSKYNFTGTTRYDETYSISDEAKVKQAGRLHVDSTGNLKFIKPASSSYGIIGGYHQIIYGVRPIPNSDEQQSDPIIMTEIVTISEEEDG